jgi:hypothetical protein
MAGMKEALAARNTPPSVRKFRKLTELQIDHSLRKGFCDV